jgi:DNA-binding NarL/FixJ family response regulator
MIQILSGLKRGKTRQQVAHELGISVSTLKTHLWRTYRRLNAQNAVEAVAKALEQGMIE